ncbi:VWA domain-containing protein [Microbulbifer sediminum]|uniref:VWA domain-containing protein n=1 Tax=Microbulbifer sediminum TaxID=2904250 RepID=UPI001F3D604F|nr:VWA domain-containing protein [Microbulbifer sediminum]
MSWKRNWRAAVALFIIATSVVLGGCGEPNAHKRGVYMLVDTSGTYSRELDKAQQVINYTLARLQPGDTFAVASINTASFSEKNIHARVTFDDRPSVTNRQKQAFQESVAAFVDDAQPAEYTDITGGLLQAIEFLNEKDPGHKTILLFSDLKEEIKSGYNRDVPLDLQGFELIALNVTKLHSDNVDPNEYLDRIAGWQQRVEETGGTWQVVNDLGQLETILP